MDMVEYVKYILHHFTFTNWEQADRVLKKHYETVFGIFDHRSSATQGNRPFSGMAVLEGNSMGVDTTLMAFLEDYTSKNIREITNMDFETYLTLTKDQRKQVDEKCKKRSDYLAAQAEANDAKIARDMAQLGKTPPAPTGARPQNMGLRPR